MESYNASHFPFTRVEFSDEAVDEKEEEEGEKEEEEEEEME